MSSTRQAKREKKDVNKAMQRMEYVNGDRVKSGMNGFNATLLMRGLVITILVVSVLAMFTAVASAADIYVDPGQTYSTIQSAENAAAADDTDEIIISLPQWDVSVQRDAAGFARFRGKHLQQIGETGEPSIPYQVVTVLLPPNVDLATLKARVISPQWEEVGGEWDIPPIPPVATCDGEKVLVMWPEGKNIVGGKDMDVYTTDADFPAEPIGRVDTIVMRKWNMAQVFYATYSYNPVEKALHRLSGDSLEITFDRTESQPVPSDNIGIEQVKQLAINFDEAVGEYYVLFAKSSPGRYVIITTSAIQSASTKLLDFVASKEARGFTVQVVNEGTWGGGTGDTAAENIRSWLQGNYSALDIEYVLLIGNPNSSSGDVPMKMCYPQDFNLAYPECPTDFYYAELSTSNNWDLDGDLCYGEYDDDFDGSPPRDAEVAVGRIPYYGSITDLDHILSKIITYENTQAPDGTWRQKVLLPMNRSDYLTPGYHLGEEIKSSTLIPKGWDYHRVYDANYSLTPPPETIPCTVTGVTNAWKGSQFGGIFWWTHGDATSASYVMDVPHAAKLDDNHPGFTFQSSCTNGHPETTNNLGYSLLKNGCISTVSASRVSWYQPGQTSFAGTATNSGMTYEYSKRLITEEMRAGNALNDLKLDIAPGDEVLWMNYLGFNVYGCPAVGLFTFGPQGGAITSCNLEGGEINQFAPNQSVYAKGEGLEANTNYKIWIQDDPVNDSDALIVGENPSAETPKNVTTDSTGNFSPMLIWSIPIDAVVTYHKYDIVVDKQNDGANTGNYTADSDGIDSVGVVGFTAPVPELPTIILFSIGLLMLLGFTRVWREDK